MKTLQKAFVLAITLLGCLKGVLFAQAADVSSHEDFMNSNGKIYVVVAVIVVIVVALFAYLFYLDRKMTRMEKDQE